MFFVPSRELISRSDTLKASKFGTLAHQCLLSKTVLGILDIRCPSHTLADFKLVVASRVIFVFDRTIQSLLPEKVYVSTKGGYGIELAFDSLPKETGKNDIYVYVWQERHLYL